MGPRRARLKTGDSGLVGPDRQAEIGIQRVVGVLCVHRYAIRGPISIGCKRECAVALSRIHACDGLKASTGRQIPPYMQILPYRLSSTAIGCRHTLSPLYARRSWGKSGDRI